MKQIVLARQLHAPAPALTLESKPYCENVLHEAIAQARVGLGGT